MLIHILPGRACLRPYETRPLCTDVDVSVCVCVNQWAKRCFMGGKPEQEQVEFSLYLFLQTNRKGRWVRGVISIFCPSECRVFHIPTGRLTDGFLLPFPPFLATFPSQLPTAFSHFRVVYQFIHQLPYQTPHFHRLLPLIAPSLRVGQL